MSGNANPRFVRLPDLVSYCSVPLRVNPLGDTCASSTHRWIMSSGSLSRKSIRMIADLRATHFASLAWPTANLSGLHLGADYLDWVFVVDDIMEDMGSEDATQLADLILNVFHWPERYAEDVENGTAPALVHLTYHMWNSMQRCSAPDVDARFIEGVQMYFQAVQEESAERFTDIDTDLKSYITWRRDGGGVKPTVALIQYVSGINLPRWLMEDPIIRKMENAANDLITMANDVCSFNKEQAQGNTYNVISIIMREKGIAMQEAFDFLGDLWQARLMEFTEDRNNLPSWGPDLDGDVEIYVQGLADWIAANLNWHFASHRYFSDKGEEVKKQRVIELLPKHEMTADL